MSKEDALTNLVATLTETNRVLLERLERLEAGQRPEAPSRLMSTDEQFHAQMKAFRSPPGEPDTEIPGVISPMTENTLDMVIQKGVVIRFATHLHKKYTTYVADGGLVPDGMIMLDPQMRGGKTREYNAWLSTIYPRDNLFFVGKPFPEYLRPKTAPVDVAAE